ncbi:MAG: MerR family transcriptional regulator [Sedimentisphaerales bacterium]|nr:MerR family transcriptional regulator [Sedimentisphaerales bacterium]
MGPKTGLVPIGVAAKRAGISRQSLQYYLMIGLLEPTEVTRTGRRLFDLKTVERIRLVKKLNRSGYTLRDIRETFLEGRTDLSAARLSSSKSGRRDLKGSRR